MKRRQVDADEEGAVAAVRAKVAVLAVAKRHVRRVLPTAQHESAGGARLAPAVAELHAHHDAGGGEAAEEGVVAGIVEKAGDDGGVLRKQHAAPPRQFDARRGVGVSNRDGDELCGRGEGGGV